MSRSERRDHPDLAYRLFDQDQTHVLALLASYDLGQRLSRSAGAFATPPGMPRTPVVGHYLNSLSGYYEPIFGAQNSIRIPRSTNWTRAPRKAS